MPYTIQIDTAVPQLKAGNKEQVLRALAQKASFVTGCSEDLLFARLCEQEQQSSSEIGDGVAVAHFKTPAVSGRYVGLATLKNPIKFSAADEQDVDLVCILISPEDHGGLHLRGLSRISRAFKNEDLCYKLRDAKDEETMQSLFENPDGWLLAA